MIEMLLGMAFSYIAFTENGHKLGNKIVYTVAQEGKKMLGAKAKDEPKEEKEEKENEA